MNGIIYINTNTNINTDILYINWMVWIESNSHKIMWLSLHWIQFTLFWNSIAMRFNRINDFLKNFLTYNKKLEMKSSVKRTNEWMKEWKNQTNNSIDWIWLQFSCNWIAISNFQFPILIQVEMSENKSWIEKRRKKLNEKKVLLETNCCCDTLKCD